MQEEKPIILAIATHMVRYYKTHKLMGFCKKHGLNINSARKVAGGSEEYPGVKLAIEEAITTDLKEYAPKAIPSQSLPPIAEAHS